jgi:hypothetical protein
MAIKKNLCLLGLLCTFLLNTLPNLAHAENPFGQTIQINTHLNSLQGKPTWLLVLRNVETGQVLPYYYEIKNFDNFWIALSFGRNYRITASTLQYEAHKTIQNFCQLQDGIISGKSFVVSLTGDLRPHRNNYQCHVLKFKEYNFPVVE